MCVCCGVLFRYKHHCCYIFLLLLFQLLSFSLSRLLAHLCRCVAAAAASSSISCVQHNTIAWGRYISPFVMLIVKTTHWTASSSSSNGNQRRASMRANEEPTAEATAHGVHVCVYVEKIAVKCCKVTTVYIRSWIAEESTRVFKFLGVFSLNGLKTFNRFLCFVYQEFSTLYRSEVFRSNK